jgi:hypothetical protein
MRYARWGTIAVSTPSGPTVHLLRCVRTIKSRELNSEGGFLSLVLIFLLVWQVHCPTSYVHRAERHTANVPTHFVCKHHLQVSQHHGLAPAARTFK